MNEEMPKAQSCNGLAGLEDFVKKNSDYFNERYPDSTKLDDWKEFLSYIDKGVAPMHSGEYVRHLQSEMDDETRMDLVGSWNQAQTEPAEGLYRFIQIPVESPDPKPPLTVKFFENGRLTFSWGPRN